MLDPIQRLLNERYLLQQELYMMAAFQGRTHPDTVAKSRELDEVCLQLQRTGVVIDGALS